MTKNAKAVIILINMRITVKHLLSQLSLFVCIMVFFSLSSCKANKEETPVIPPVTSPLSRDYIGFGVITASFTHIKEDPADDSRSLGYLRRGSLVRIVRRQVVRTQEGYVSWVLTDGKQDMSDNQQGWLKEDIMEIYNNESQAKTASESILK